MSMNVVTQAKPRPSMIVIFGGSFVALMMLFALYAVVSSAFAPAPAPTWERLEEKARADEKIMAWVMAKDFVKERLKSPGSAEFDHMTQGETQLANDTTVAILRPGTATRAAGPDGALETADDTAQLNGGEYRVRGWVDSQNGFGATVRARFDVRLRHEGESWELIGIEVRE